MLSRLVVSVCLACTVALVLSTKTVMRKHVRLPDRLLVGYANWNQCDDSIVRAVQHGVNVVIWFAINLSMSEDGSSPSITNGPDWLCVAKRVQEIRSLGYSDVVHLISIGGWNAPHPVTAFSAQTLFDTFHNWNTQTVANEQLGFDGFDGFDWDIEGNDDVASPFNSFTVDTLNIMGELSQIARKHNYVVAMAPAESYLDMRRPSFDRSLSHEYAEWQELIEHFPYHGLNCYAYLLARFGTTILSDSCDASCSQEVETFSFVTVQLYEGYSHVQHEVTVRGLPASIALANFVRNIAKGVEIDFSLDAELNFPHRVLVHVPAERLVVGLANGWAGDGKFLLIFPEEVSVAYQALQEEQLAPRGFAFWNILDEGRASALRPDQPLWLAKGIDCFLNAHNRQCNEEIE